MSVYDTFLQSQKTQATGSPAGVTGNAQALPSGGPPPKDANAQPVKSVYDQWLASKKTGALPSVYDQFKQSQQTKTSAEPNYFYGKTDNGGTIGKSSELDTSGKPFLGYRNPGDTATSTDKMRTATTFDPTKVQKLTADTFHTPRAVNDRAGLKQAMGGTYSDQLDHKISLELSGSNDPSNLQIEPLVGDTKKTATDDLENSLAGDVANGKISLFDAQAKLAKAKGLPAPWGTDKKGWIQKTWESIKNAVMPEAHAAEKPETQGSVYNQFLASQKAPVTNFKSADDFTKESTRLSGSQMALNVQGEKLDKEQKTLDTTDKAAVDRFNTEVNDYNQKREAFLSDIDKFNKAVETYKKENADKFYDEYVKAGGTTIGPEKVGNYEKNEVPPVDENDINIKIPFQDKNVSFPAPWSTVVSGPPGNESLRSPVANFLLNLPTNIIEAIPRALVTVKKEFDTMGTTQTVKMGPISSTLYGGTTTEYKNINQEIKERLDRGDGILASYLGAISGKVLDVAFGAQIGASSLRGLSKSLAQDNTNSTIEAWKTFGSPKDPVALQESYLQLAKQFHPDLMHGDESAMKVINQAKQLLEKNGIPSPTKIQLSRYAEWVGRETKLGSPILSPDLKIKTDVGGNVLPLKQLPGYKEIAPSPIKAGLSAQPIQPVGFGPKKPVYEGDNDLTVGTLEKLKGRSEISKQFISDLTNSSGIKQQERDVVRQVLSEYPESKPIPVQEFAEKVKAELLPLERSSVDKPHYEGVALPEGSRGEVASYSEHIYNSPIETSAGDVHFNDQDHPGYFGHTRIEDLPSEDPNAPTYSDGTTRRIIEVQSDLYQKGNLEKERAIPAQFPKSEMNEAAIKFHEERIAKRDAELAKLKQYSNPTAHYRMVREEIKQAAKDGKHTVLFPTGETAMKIEGLHNLTSDAWSTSGDIFDRPQVGDLKVGVSLFDRSSEQWVITKVLGDGKFEAVPKEKLDGGMARGKMFDYSEKLGENEKSVWDRIAANYSESFDISTKLDTNNPIYRFYEKDLARYLKNNHGATLFTDKQGVTWWKVGVKPEEATKPVQAFKKGKGARGYDLPIDEIRRLLYKEVPKEKLQLIFTDVPPAKGADGTYQGSLNPRVSPIIKIWQSGGKASIITGYHEVGHYITDPKNGLTTPEERQELIDEAKKAMGDFKKADYFVRGYRSADDIALEHVLDVWAKQKAADEGFHGPFKRAAELLNSIFKKIVDIYNKVSDFLDSHLPEKGRQGGYVGFGKEEAPPAGESEYTVASRNSAKIFDESKGQEPISVAGKVFDIGDFGRNAFRRKGGIKGDRFDEKELPDTLEHVVESVPASTDPTNWRSDNTAHIAEMPDGEKRVVYTRVNARGNAEVINWHKVSNEQYLEDLRNGVPARSRTEMASLEEKQSNPLTYGDKAPETVKSVAEPTESVNVDKSEKAIQNIAPETRARIEKSVNEEHLNSILDMISSSKDAEHIAAILFSDFGIPMRESQTLGERLKHINSTVNVKKVIEGDELLRKRILNEPIMQKIPEPLYYRLLSNELEGESLRNAQARGLAKYAARSGIYRGALPEMPSNKASINMTEVGFQNWEEARKAYDKYAASKVRFEEEKSLLKKDLRKFIESQRLGDMTAEWKEYLRKEKLTQAEENELARHLTTASNLKDKMRILKQSKIGRMRLSRARLRLIDRLTYQDIPALERDTQSSVAAQEQQIQGIYRKEFETLPKIIASEPTPVKRKVGMIDYLRTPDRVLNKIGLGQASDMIRHGYESYVAELPGHIELLHDWDKRIEKGKTTKQYDASKKRIFHYLDGTLDNYKDPLSTSERRVAGEMKLYLRDWADRLDLPSDNRVTHYITHIFEQSLMGKEFDEDLAKIIRDKVPGSVYDPFLQSRLGAKGFVEDPIRALEAYAKRAVRKANMDPALEYLKAASGRLELSQLDYVKRFADRVNLRPTEWDNLLDNTIKQIIGYRLGARPVASITRSARRAVYRAMLGLNVGSAIKNLTQGVNTYAVLGEKYTLIGYTNLFTKMGSDELQNAGIFGMDIIQDKTISAYKKGIQKMDGALFAMFNTVEHINRASAYWGAKAKAIDEGKHEAAAIEYAKKVVRDTQFTYGTIDTPAALQSDLVKTLTQFTTFSFKETEFLAEMVKAKNWAGLLRYIGASVLLVYALGKILNISYKDFLPISFLTRFGSAPVLALPMEILKAILNAPDAYGKIPSPGQRAMSLVDTAVSYLPASAQANRTYQGEQKMFNPKTPTDEVPKTPGNVAKALILGPSNIDTAKSTFKDSTSRLQGLLGQSKGSVSRKAEDEFKRLNALPADQADVEWKKINDENPALANRIDQIKKENDLGLTPEERLIKQLNVSLGVRAQYIYKKMLELPDAKSRNAMWDDYAKKGIITKNVEPQLLKLIGAQ